MWARCWWWIYLGWFLLANSFSEVHASASLYHSKRYPHGPTGDSSSYIHRSNQSRRSKIFPGTFYSQTRVSSTAVHLAARKEKTKEIAIAEPEASGPREVSFDDLGPVGKVVAASTELGVAILYNYCQGFLTGWIAGTLLGVPGLMFRPVERGVPQIFITELKGRLGRMNSRSVRFGKSFGGISAIFKGSDVAVRRFRYGKNDEWNDILGSAVAGAIFARKGKQGVSRTYGTMMGPLLSHSYLKYPQQIIVHIFRGPNGNGERRHIMGRNDFSAQRC